jgi:hypothetical protein
VAVAKQTTGTPSNTSVGAGSLTFSFTVSAGSDKALAVMVAMENTTKDVSGVTYDSDALTQVNSDVPSGGDWGEAQMWRIIDASATGGDLATTANIVVTVTGDPYRVIGMGISMTGVHQTTPTGTPNSNASTGATSSSVTVASVDADGLLIDVVGLDSDVDCTAGANQTNEITGGESAPGGCTLAVSTQDGGDGGVMSWSFDGTESFGHLAVEFKPSASGGATSAVVTRMLCTMGMGR